MNVPPPPGFNQPDVHHSAAINGAVAVTTSIALVSVLIRTWVRVKVVGSMAWDDYWIIAAMVISFMSWMVVIPEVHYGAGRHTFYILRDLGPEGLKTGLKLNFTTQVTYVFAIAAIKVSVGLFLLRLTPSKHYKYFIWSILGFVAFYTIVGTATLLGQCRPFAMHFDFNIPGGKCFAVKTSQALAYTNAACNILTDFIFAFIPTPLLWKLKINKRVKVSVIGILSLGLFAACASIVKLYYLTGYGRFGDFLYDSTYLTIWVSTECNVGIFAASIPALKPLFKAVLGASYGSGSGYLGGQGSRYKNGYAQQSSSKRNRASGLGYGKNDFELRQGRNSTAVIANKRRDRDKFDPDNISEESILPLQSNAIDQKGGIMKTTQIVVNSHETDKPRKVEDRV